MGRANGGSWSRYFFYVLEDNTSCEEGNLPFLRATWGRLGNPKSDVSRDYRQQRYKTFLFILQLEI